MKEVVQAMSGITLIGDVDNFKAAAPLLFEVCQTQYRDGGASEGNESCYHQEMGVQATNGTNTPILGMLTTEKQKYL